MAGEAPVSRYFLALAPDAAAREQLRAARTPGLGRPVPAEDLHLTLAFLGDLKAPSAAALLAALEAASRQGPVAVTLDRIETWRGPRALCAVGDAPQAAVLAAALWEILEGLGYLRDTRPFQAHVTLARGLPARACGAAPVILNPPIRWTSAELQLLASGPAAATVGQPRYRLQGVRALG